MVVDVVRRVGRVRVLAKEVVVGDWTCWTRKLVSWLRLSWGSLAMSGGGGGDSYHRLHLPLRV